MPRRVFYSFHYEMDSWRASQVRNMGVVEGTPQLHDNEWETIWRGGDAAIQRWIDGQMYGKSCVVVLVGGQTHSRPWVKYEIQTGWNLGKGVVGINIHNLLDRNQRQSYQGMNPFGGLFLNGSPLANVVRTYNPPHADSRQVYAYIRQNIEAWVEEAIRIRGRY